MQERVTGTVRQRDEAKALIGVVPFDGSAHGCAEGVVEVRTARRRVSKIARRWLVVVVGQITAAGRAKISLSVAHVSVPGEGAITFGWCRAIVNDRPSPRRDRTVPARGLPRAFQTPHKPITPKAKERPARRARVHKGKAAR
jgi:hypothetical protein